MASKKEQEWLLHEKYGGKETPEYEADLKRLAGGEPIDYVIGNTSFLGCTIDLTSRPLIPRVETEFWIEGIIAKLKESVEPITCLDIFAGSGCIGVSILKSLPNATVDFAEKDSSHIEQIKKNVELNNIDSTRANYFVADVFKDVPEKRYDYIFANPPYIGTSEIGQVQESVLAWESPEALFADDEGLAFIKKLIENSRDFIAHGGSVFIEFNTPQKNALETFLVGRGLRNFAFHKDQYGAWRMLEINFS